MTAWANVPSAQAIEHHSPARSLEAIDEAGVDKSILSSAIPFGDDLMPDRTGAASVARETKELGAKLVAKHPGRFRLVAFLPLGVKEDLH